MTPSTICGSASSVLIETLAGQCEELAAVCRRTQRLAQALAEDRENQKPKYLAGSMFLYDCYHALSPSPERESMFYVSGPETDGVLHLSRICPFVYDSRSAAYVSGEISSSLEALVFMEQFGHRLHGWFHSHPGAGPHATAPSSTDMGHQRLLEKGHHVAVGAIFTRDGYIRFFSHELPLNIEVYGKAVERLDERLYRLTELPALGHPADSGEAPHGGWRAGPSAEAARL